jgi:hypothetical protein
MDLDNFWRAQVATAQVIEIKEEAQRIERIENLGDSMRSQNLAAPDHSAGRVATCAGSAGMAHRAVL